MVYHHMGDYQTALQYHKLDLRISETIGSASGQARALSNLGAAYERLKNHDQALSYFEKALG
jgi:tetratricopeptide (TPR) repeat protein